MFVLEYLMFAACFALSRKAALAEGFFPKGSLSLLLGSPGGFRLCDFASVKHLETLWMVKDAK